MRSRLIRSGALVAALLVPAVAGAAARPAPGLESPRVAPSLRTRLIGSAPDAPAPVIVRFASERDLRAYLPSVDGRLGVRIHSVPMLAFAATPEEIASLARRAGVVSISSDDRVPQLMDTATYASRARAVWGTQEGGPIMVGGQVVDGSGVGVAIVDSGIAADNPDLAGQVAMNVKVISTRLVSQDADILGAHNIPFADEFVPMEHTDTTSGHGTHVAGIVAATGASSGGRVRGVAPGAKLYGFGTGEGDTIVTSFALAAFDWIVQHHASVSPPIRVVNNSWGGTGTYSATDPVVVMSDALVDAGVVVTWAAGNGDTLGNGGDCSTNLTNVKANSPKPGVISVAAYDDRDSGTRDGAIASFSSRGSRTDATTWPDLAAPGVHILSALDATGGLALAFKALDIATGGLGPGNPFGNALDQHTGTVTFHLGGVASPAYDLDWTTFWNPVAVYNAHRNTYVTSPLFGVFANVDPNEATQMRLFAPVPATAGVVHPVSESARAVTPGDAITFSHDSGTGNPITAQITSPSGDSRTVKVSFPCTAGCSTTVDLNALFHGAPADGTWTVSPGPTVGASSLAGDAANPAYVNFDGTSMAAPHVAGVVALVAQAKPSLTPAQIEAVLNGTAYKFASGESYVSDPAHPGTTSSCDKGHGLVDAKAAVLQALTM